ncbi:RNA-processing protein [archaeon]|nr:RNA-processing protein [archaeon]|tara:strand:- start:1206 stop:1856 length:651 start_codon:yes stop_codon:yes gene_type:complete
MEEESTIALEQETTKQKQEHVHTDELIHEDIKIPKDRVAVLIGSAGSTKNLIQEKTECDIDVDSENGQVEITSFDALRVFDCKDIVMAIGRGFNPKIALKLLKEEYSLEVIRLRDLVGGNQKQQERLKSRVIGREGKVRREIERLTRCEIAVYGKTISILGDSMDVTTCHRAISMLLGGAMHKTVYTFLEKQEEKERLAADQIKLADLQRKNDLEE